MVFLFGIIACNQSPCSNISGLYELAMEEVAIEKMRAENELLRTKVEYLETEKRLKGLEAKEMEDFSSPRSTSLP